MSSAHAAVAGQRVIYLAQITLSQGTLLLATQPRYGSGLEQYHAMVVDVPAIAFDHEGLTDFGITIAQRGPYRVGSFSHATLNDLLKSNPIVNRPITITRVTDTGETSINAVSASGRIARVTDITPESISFECGQRIKLEQRFVPYRKIDKTLFSTNPYRKRIPPDSDGAAMPVSFGRFLSYVPPLFKAATNTEIQQKLNLWFPPVTAQALRLQTAGITGQGDRSVYAYAEYVDAAGHCLVDTNSNDPSIDGYMWLDPVGSFGRIWELSDEDGLNRHGSTYQSVAYCVDVGKQPYVVGGITAAKYVAAESTGTITDPEHAIDRRMDTWCTIGVGATACWEVRIATGIGRLSMNTHATGGGSFPLQNWEGPNRPGGVASAALLAFPSSSWMPTSGLVRIALKYPGATTTNAFGISDYSPFTLLTAGMRPNGVAPISRQCSVASTSGRTGEFDDGWAGTKWERGDFSAGGSDDGPDRAIFLVGNNDSRPMRVAITNNSDKQIAVTAAGMQCAFKVSADDRVHRHLANAMAIARKIAEANAIIKKGPRNNG